MSGVRIVNDGLGFILFFFAFIFIHFPLFYFILFYFIFGFILLFFILDLDRRYDMISHMSLSLSHNQIIQRRM